MEGGGRGNFVGGDAIQETEDTPLTTTTTSMPTLSSDKSLISRSKCDNSSISIQEGPSTKRRRLSHAQDMELDSDSEMAEMVATPTMIDN